MRLRRAILGFLFLFPVLLIPARAQAADPRLARAARTEAAGWIHLRLEGSPHDIGYQHGSLLSVEIDDAIRALKHETEHHKQTWKLFRDESQRLFWTRLDPEYRAELEGIAEGLKTRGMAYDAQDILAYNAHIEIGGYHLPQLEANRKHGSVRSRAPESCSAFVATGSATADGKIVMGHNLWWSYLMGQRWRVMLDIRPEKGHRILMDALPGFIHSGSDFAINSAGILVTETTIGGFHGFDEKGLPEFMRARKAVQYAGSLDDFVRIMSDGNNGGYANTWLVGDTKTNEIGKLEMGLKNVIFSRSRDGAYYGANYPEDPKLAEEECDPGAADDFSCVNRRARWKKLLADNQGKVDSEAAKRFLADTYDQVLHKQGASGSTLCGRNDLDARSKFRPGGAVNSKVVSSDMARAMKVWARMGFSDGSELNVQEYFRRVPDLKWLAPFLRDIKAEPWTLIEADK